MSKSLRKIKSENYTISMESFIIRYLNDDNEIDCFNLKHCDLKHFDIPYIISLSYETVAKHIDLLLKGKIIFVKDKQNKIIPYINPFYLKEIEDIQYQEQEILVSEDCLLMKKLSSVRETIEILRELKKDELVEKLGGRQYVKKY